MELIVRLSLGDLIIVHDFKEDFECDTYMAVEEVSKLFSSLSHIY